MKLWSEFIWLFKVLCGGSKKECWLMLEQQRALLHHGVESTAEVLDTYVFDESMGNLFPVRLWVKLKRNDGNFIYTHTSTLMSLKEMPGKGQTLKIKYFPDNLSSILVL
jgi:hypothetical protein